MPYNLFEKISQIDKSALNGIDYSLISKNWWQSEAGKNGISSLAKKYGDQTLKNWRISNLKKARRKVQPNNTKQVNLPNYIDEDVAEFTGVYLGDGTLTKYFIRISGDKRFDVKYFEYLNKLTKKIFGIEGAIREEKTKNQLYLNIRSKKISDYFQTNLNFKTGDKIKNKSKIPEQILNDKSLFFACLRGLVDTDGSVSKDNNVISVRLHSNNTVLLEQLKQSNFLDRIFSIKSNKEQIGTKSLNKIKEYFKISGSSNPRHIIRFQEYLKGNLLRQKEVLQYYKNYESLQLPFKIG